MADSTEFTRGMGKARVGTTRGDSAWPRTAWTLKDQWRKHRMFQTGTNNQKRGKAVKSHVLTAGEPRIGSNKREPGSGVGNTLSMSWTHLASHRQEAEL